MKSRISKKHREKPSEDEEKKDHKKLKDKDKKSFEFNMDDLKEWIIPEDKGGHQKKKRLSFGHSPKGGGGGSTGIKKFWGIFF